MKQIDERISRGRHGTQVLVIARISDPSGWGDLEQKIREVWALNLGVEVPGHIVQMGVEPLRDPDCVNGRGGVEGRTRWVMFQAAPGVHVLYVLGSAVQPRADDDDDNTFTTLACRMIEEFAPFALAVPHLDRLVRSVPNAGRVWGSLSGHCEHLIAGDGNIDLTEPDAEARFVIRVMGSSSEAAAIRRRMVGGRLDLQRTGCTSIPKNQVPLGYRKTEDKRVVVDPSSRPIVEAILTGIAAGDSNKQIVAAAAKAGGTTAQLKGTHGPNATYADYSNPAEAVQRWKGWIPLWATGKFDYRWRCPSPNVDKYLEFDVVGSGPGLRGHIILPQDWGLPSGGWAPAHILRECLQQVRAKPDSSRQGGTHHGIVKPLAGASWSTDDHDYRLFTQNTGQYLLRRRSIGTGGPKGGWGRRPDIDGEVIAKIPSRELHQSIAHGIADAIEAGVAGKHLTGVHTLQLRGASTTCTTNELMDLEAKRSTLVQERSNLISAVGTTREDDVRRDLVAEADKRSLQITELDAEISRLSSPVASGVVEGDVTVAVRSLGALAQIENGAERQVGEALARLLPDLTITVSEDTAQWSTSVQLPTAGGTLRLGPITGTVDTRTGRVVRSVANRAEEITAEFMETGVALDDLVRSHNRKSREQYERAIHTVLESKGIDRGLRTLLVNGFLAPSTRQAIWRHLRQRRVPGESRAWVTAVVSAYLNGNQTYALPGNLRRALAPRERIAESLLAAGGRLDVASLVRDAHVTEAQVRTAITRAQRSGHSGQPSIIHDPDRPETHVALIECPHCDGWASQPMMQADVPAGVLCPACRRMPTADSPVYPSDYFPAKNVD